MQPMLTSPASGPVPGVPMHQPTNLFRFGEITLYSSQAISAAAGPVAGQTYRLFSTQIGGTGQGFVTPLTKSETNLKEPGRVPNGQAYDVYGVAAQVSAGTPAGIGTPVDNAGDLGNLVGIVANGILSWDFTQTTVDICPVMLAGAGGGVFGFAALDAQAAPAALGHANNGNGGVWMYKKHLVALPGSTTFAILLQFGSRTPALAAETGVVVRVVLLGLYKSVIEIG
jgi:hypothetical protein